uniref:Ras association domain family member 1 n=1 Tax=Pipistrellus kuhlii TaxID=59472 RepID=A0A7J7WE27_PIPKU|nr:Ras association domain family member 1 [Pipistrellus kuhlii]
MGEADAETPSFEMTWSSTTSSGYCSQEDSDSELEQYFTARTSLGRRPRRDQDELVQWETPDLSQAEIEQKIKEYNGQINSNLFMSLNKDGSYTGFIKVQLKLVRPVSVPASRKPPSLQDARRGPARSAAVRRRTSFYLPKDAVKHLHVLSRTRAREVIEALLRKFSVVDDPRKFALFERAERHGQVGCLQHAGAPQLPAHPAAGGRGAPAPDPAQVLPVPPEAPGGPARLSPGVTSPPGGRRSAGSTGVCRVSVTGPVRSEE